MTFIETFTIGLVVISILVIAVYFLRYDGMDTKHIHLISRSNSYMAWGITYSKTRNIIFPGGPINTSYPMFSENFICVTIEDSKKYFIFKLRPKKSDIQKCSSIIYKQDDIFFLGTIEDLRSNTNTSPRNIYAVLYGEIDENTGLIKPIYNEIFKHFHN